MLETVRNIHRGRSIAVLGSGPTLELFEGKEDISIAVNGAAGLNIPYNYFMCHDKNSPTRQWFYLSEKHKAIRIIGQPIAIYDKILYPDTRIREMFQEERAHLDKEILPFIPPSIPPKGPHFWFTYSPLGIGHYRILPELKNTHYLLCGGSISCGALQMAYVMGAREIHVYGCPMENPDGLTYYIQHPQDPPGSLNDFKIKSFNRMIKYIMDRQTPVYVHGESALVGAPTERRPS